MKTTANSASLLPPILPEDPLGNGSEPIALVPMIQLLKSGGPKKLSNEATSSFQHVDSPSALYCDKSYRYSITSDSKETIRLKIVAQSDCIGGLRSHSCEDKTRYAY